MSSRPKFKQYIRDGGTHCPFCGGTNLSGESVDIESGYAYQEVFCGDCVAVWTDNYKLVSCTRLTSPIRKPGREN